MIPQPYNSDMDPVALSPLQGIQLYLDSRELLVAAEQASKDALADARRDLTRFGTWLETTLPCVKGGQSRQTLAQCRNDDLTRWLLANPQWKSPNTKKRVLNTILACFKWLEDEGHGRNPFRRPRGLKFPAKARREATRAEYVAFMRKGTRCLRRALYFLFNCGARTCEMREIIWPDIHWDDSVIFLYQHKTARLTGQPRIVGLTPRILRWLRNLFRQRSPWPENVFVNSDGAPWNRRSFALHLRRVAKRLGLDEGVADKVSGYCFRHTAATEGDEAGIQDRRVATFLGHSDTKMLNNYSKARKKPQHVREVALEMEAARRLKRKEGRIVQPKTKKPDWVQAELF